MQTLILNSGLCFDSIDSIVWLMKITFVLIVLLQVEKNKI